MNSSKHSDIDSVDVGILKILSKNGCVAFNKIALELNKSPVTIKKHVEDLEAKGIIEGYGAKINFERLGYDIIAFIEITVSKGKSVKYRKQLLPLASIP